MFKHNLMVSWRNQLRNGGYASLNIIGLTIGLMVSLLIGLWVHDEVSYNSYHTNKEHIARLQQVRLVGDGKEVWWSTMIGTADAVREKYGADFDKIGMASFFRSRIISHEDKKFSERGIYMQQEVFEMFTIKITSGSRASISQPQSILISESMARKFFGDENPLNKTITISGEHPAQVSGVFADFPRNDYLGEITWIGSWEFFLNVNPWMTQLSNPWGYSGFQTFVQRHKNGDFDVLEEKIKNILIENVRHDKHALVKKPTPLFHPMTDWHLRSNFDNGVKTGGRILYVRMFATIGIFVLILACINFINLTTAYAERRTKEVGIRKSLGSLRPQLVKQFLIESLLVVSLASTLALGCAQLALPQFNEIADKQISIPWSLVQFWTTVIATNVFIGLLAGFYPAIVLSAKKPAFAIKSSSGIKYNSLPRKVLVVVQFVVSITLVIGTVLIYQQIQYAQSRPLGYEQENLLMLERRTGDMSLDILENELGSRGNIESMARSDSPVTGVWNNAGGFDWPGKDPDLGVSIANYSVSHDFGKTINWNIKSGRDFSRDFPTDTAAFIANEEAVKLMGFSDPIGTVIHWNGSPMQIIGVVENMLVESPYHTPRPHLYYLRPGRGSIYLLKLMAGADIPQVLNDIEKVAKQHYPDVVYTATMVTDSYGQKFSGERRVGKLTSVFAFLAIVISCLGLLGLASFMAERRTKEIGIRKVLGASVTTLWTLLCRDYVLLAGISGIVAAPLAYYFISTWLQNFEYRIQVSGWLFISALCGAIIISLLTVSYQAIKAALANPTDSLRNE